jgi:predicted regulator of Ras-like GTPase activity (Roadblock/LC7/MglB family)
MPTIDAAPEEVGFHGDVAGLSLSDVIQLNGNNGFSGCITVQQGDRTGRIFFREGKLVHAEQGGKSGEEAFTDIMEWRSGHFTLAPNVSTTSHSIQKSTQFMLMEAHRLIDERRAGRPTPPPPGAEPAATRKPSPPTIAERLRGVVGVRHAVLVGKDGAYHGDGTLLGEALAGQTAFLSGIANRIGAALGAGEVRTAALRRTTQHLLIFATKHHQLGVQVDGTRDIGGAEADILRLLGPTP